MAQRGRAFRRDQVAKRKAQARRLWRQWFPDGGFTNGGQRGEPPTGQWVGRMASTHCRPCSCRGCRHPKGEREKRIELRARLSEQEQRQEVCRDWKDWRGQLRAQRRTVLRYEECLAAARAGLVEMKEARWPDWPVW